MSHISKCMYYLNHRKPFEMHCFDLIPTHIKRLRILPIHTLNKHACAQFLQSAQTLWVLSSKCFVISVGVLLDIVEICTASEQQDVSYRNWIFNKNAARGIVKSGVSLIQRRVFVFDLCFLCVAFLLNFQLLLAAFLTTTNIYCLCQLVYARWVCGLLSDKPLPSAHVGAHVCVCVMA